LLLLQSSPRQQNDINKALMYIALRWLKNYFIAASSTAAIQRRRSIRQKRAYFQGEQVTRRKLC
jgi:hypothetical protein